AREAKAAHEIVGTIDLPVSVDVLQDRDAVGPCRTAWWWFWHSIVGCPRITIDGHPFETRRIGILQVLNHPQSAQIVEFDCHRLADQRLGSNELRVKPWRNPHPPRRVFWRITLSSRRTHKTGDCDEENQSRAVVSRSNHHPQFC